MSNSTSEPKPTGDATVIEQPESKNRTRADAVRIRLTEEIVTGTLLPGERLDEITLAARFEVSRTPVREALRELAASGLIEWRPRQGAVVASISIGEMVGLFEMMAEFEGIAGRLSARRMTDKERSSLREDHNAFEPHAKRGDREKYQAFNHRFHVAIYNGSHNQYLIAQATALYDRLASYRHYELNRPGEVMRAYQEHARIVDAIVSRDGDLAYHLLKEHTTLDADLLGDLMAALLR